MYENTYYRITAYNRVDLSSPARDNDVATVIHYGTTDEARVSEAELIEEQNAIPTLSFKIYPNNPGYDKLIEFDTLITLEEMGDEAATDYLGEEIVTTYISQRLINISYYSITAESVDYTGKYYAGEIKVYDGAGNILDPEFYELTFYDENGNETLGEPREAGIYTVKATGKGEYTGTTKETSFEIYILDISDFDIKATSPSYTGEPYIEPLVWVYFPGTFDKLSSKDYYLTFYDTEGNALNEPPTEIGTYSVDATGIGSCAGTTAPAVFNITAIELNYDDFAITAFDEHYTGEQYPTSDVVVTDLNAHKALNETTDYELEFSQVKNMWNYVLDEPPTEIGTYNVSAIGIGHYTGVIRTSFSILDELKNPASVRIKNNSYIYDAVSPMYTGKPYSPDNIEVIDEDGNVMESGSYGLNFYRLTDYEYERITNDEIIDAGTYYVQATGPDKSTDLVAFKIIGWNGGEWFEVDAEDAEYTGEPYAGKVHAYLYDFPEIPFVENRDYILNPSRENVVEPGKYRFSIKVFSGSTGNFRGVSDPGSYFEIYDSVAEPATVSTSVSIDRYTLEFLPITAAYTEDIKDTQTGYDDYKLICPDNDAFRLASRLEQATNEKGLIEEGAFTWIFTRMPGTEATIPVTRYLFEGRVLENIINQDSDGLYYREITCEGLMGFLCDSMQPYLEEKTWEDDAGSTGLMKYMEHLLYVHNSQVEDHKKIYIAVCDTSTHLTNEQVTKGTNWDSTWDVISEKLLDVFGGEIKISRGSDGLLYLYYTDKMADLDVVTQPTQPIKLGKNISDGTSSPQISQVITRLYPLGAKLEDEEGSDTDERLTIEEAKESGGLAYIEDEEAVKRYGIVSAINEWDDVETADNLYTKAVEWLAENNNFPVSLSLTAYDLSLLGLEYARLELYSRVEVDAETLETENLTEDGTLEIVKRTLNIDEPWLSSLEFGETTRTASMRYAMLETQVLQLEK